MLVTMKRVSTPSGPSSAVRWTDAGEDPLHPPPAAGAIEKLLVAALLLGARRGSAQRRGAPLQRFDVTAQRGRRGDTKDEVQALGAAEVEHLRRAVVAVRADQDLDPWPMATDGAHQPAEKAASLPSARPLRGAQHGGDRAPLAVEYHDRLETVLVVVSVEQPQLLLPMDRIERVVDIEHDAPRDMPEAAAVELDHGPAHTQQGSCPR